MQNPFSENQKFFSENQKFFSETYILVNMSMNRKLERRFPGPGVNRNDHGAPVLAQPSKSRLTITNTPTIIKKQPPNQDNNNRIYPPNFSYGRPVSPQSQTTGQMFNPHPLYRPHTPQNRPPLSLVENQFSDRQPVNFFPSTPIPIPDSYCKYSLAQFVTSFQDQTDFNETDLSKLGINLDTEEPILPHLHSVFSDAPLLFSTHIPPNSYKDFPTPSFDMNSFDKETLFLIFYTQPQQQSLAANELISKYHFTWDENNLVWKTGNDTIWDVTTWKEIPNPKATPGG